MPRWEEFLPPGLLPGRFPARSWGSRQERNACHFGRLEGGVNQIKQGANLTDEQRLDWPLLVAPCAA
jgi:hypothetical protein